MKNNELKNFYNKGFGWVCKKCEQDLQTENEEARLMKEGEAESKNPILSNKAMAKWKTSDRTELECLRCKITETVK